MDIGAPELIIIMIVVLLIFGPGRIVKLSHELGVSIRQFRQGLEAHPEQNKKMSLLTKENSCSVYESSVLLQVQSSENRR